MKQYALPAIIEVDAESKDDALSTASAWANSVNGAADYSDNCETVRPLRSRKNIKVVGSAATEEE